MFYFHPYLGKMIQFDKYFSDGLKPPTRFWVVKKREMFCVDPLPRRPGANEGLGWDPLVKM